jgi:FAD/FMN-containing dehydrogenase
LRVTWLGRDRTRSGSISARASFEGTAAYLRDETEASGFRGRADAVVLPGSADEVARVLAWCYEHDVSLVPRGGGTGFAGGAVPLDGGVVLGLERLARIRAFEPLLWRIWVEAGVTTGTVRRLARENGLLPPIPARPSSRRSAATSRRTPVGCTRSDGDDRVVGDRARGVVPPGEIVSVGGSIRKDVAGYDLKSLLVGSEGTLGIVTAAWLRLLPAPEAALPVAAFYVATQEGCASIERVLGNGLVVAAIEYLDAATLAAAGSSFPAEVPPDAAFLVIAEADGSRSEAERLTEPPRPRRRGRRPPPTEPSVRTRRWRDGVDRRRARGGKVARTSSSRSTAAGDRGDAAIGARHGLPAQRGHAATATALTFLVAADDEDGLTGQRSPPAFAGVRCGGSIPSNGVESAAARSAWN